MYIICPSIRLVSALTISGSSFVQFACNLTIVSIYDRRAAAKSRRNVRRRHARLSGFTRRLCSEVLRVGDTRLSVMDGQSLPTVTKLYRSIGSGLYK
jgi:hypothetical protein